MADDESDDRIIRERKFKRSSSIDVIDIDFEERSSQDTDKPEQDEAVGDVFDPFVGRGSDTPGVVQFDGT